mgnify:CR=1 FL=1
MPDPMPFNNSFHSRHQSESSTSASTILVIVSPIIESGISQRLRLCPKESRAEGGAHNRTIAIVATQTLSQPQPLTSHDLPSICTLVSRYSNNVNSSFNPAPASFKNLVSFKNMPACVFRERMGIAPNSVTLAAVSGRASCVLGSDSDA